MKNLKICRHETQSSKSSVRVKYSDPIPVDLLIDIFSRVPSKSIARFRCVSKFWGSILQSPDFTELFRTRCPGFLFTFGVNKEILYFYSPQHPNPGDNSYVVATRYDTSFPKYIPSEYQKLMLCGLVLRHSPSERGEGRVICNPATGEFFTVPKVKSSIEEFYFGYDPINKQFKVLCVISPSNTHRVLTLDKGKRLWRRIKSEFDFTVNYRIYGQICINGVLYFGASFRGSGACGIVCFDVRSEKFSLINLDKGIVKEGFYICGAIILVNYKGKLGIHDKMKGDCNREGNNGFDLWVLEDAANHKWSKHDHKYPPTWKNILFEHEHSGMTRWRFIGMTSTGEMVFVSSYISNPFYVFYYDFERKTFTRVNIRGLEEFTIGNPYYGRTSIDIFMDYGENINLFK